MNSVVDEATLRELYLLPFEIAVAERDPWSIMAAYNDVNGVPATEQDHVQNEIVKGEWGFDGLIMSDWFATKTAAPAANGGLDLVMPGPDGPWGDALVAGRPSRRGRRGGHRRPPGAAAAAGRPGRRAAVSPRLAGRPAGAGQRRAQGAAHPAGRAGMTVLTNDDDVLPLDAGRQGRADRPARRWRPSTWAAAPRR